MFTDKDVQGCRMIPTHGFFPLLREIQGQAPPLELCQGRWRVPGLVSTYFADYAYIMSRLRVYRTPKQPIVYRILAVSCIVIHQTATKVKPYFGFFIIFVYPL